MCLAGMISLIHRLGYVMYHAYTNNFQTSSILSIMLGCNSHVLFILLLDFSHLSWKYSNKSCFVSNTQSKRVQEKCGFKEIKHIKYKTKYNTLEDCVLAIIENN